MRLKSSQDKVAEFAALIRQTGPGKPCTPSLQTCLLRHRLIAEELSELKAAWIADDVVEAADAIGDLLYVVLGAAVDCGIDIEPVFNEIHESNMSKTIDCQFREDGKVLKGPHYRPPNLKPIIDAQLV